MRNKYTQIVICIGATLAAVLMLLWLMGDIRSTITAHALAASVGTVDSPSVTAVDPTAAPNDLDTVIVITGTGFTAVPTISLGNTMLEDVGWVSTELVTTTIPWGLDPGVYDVNVINPGGESSNMTDAFTVTQGLGVWTTGGPYGGNISQVVVNPFTPTVVYAVADNVGLFASYDSAETWAPILEGKTYHFSIAIDAADPNEIFAGGGGYVYHTQDGGDTWDELIGRGSELHHCYVHQLVTHPSVSGVVYDAVSVCEGYTPPVDRSGIYFSDDHGTTWISLTQGVTDTNFTALAIQPQDPDTVLAGTESGNLFASQDGGQSWNWAAHLNDKIHTLDFNPHISGEAWASARSMISNPPPVLYKSTNLTDWALVTVDPGLTWGQDGWDLAFLDETIWAASIGVYTSTDGGANWNPVENWHDSALSLDISPDDPTQMYIGVFRNGFYRSRDGGLSWQVANDGLAGLNPNSIAVDPNDPDIVYANAEIGLLKSDNGGYYWRKLDLFTGGYPAMNQLATDPITPNKVYFGQCGDGNVQGSIYSCFSDDGGENWEQITVTLPTTMATWSGGMYVIAPHPTIPGRIFGGATVAPQNTDNDHGLIFVSDDYAENWTLLGPSTPISEILQIAIDAVNPDLVYVATRGSGLWKSTDGGYSWAGTPFTSTTIVPYVTTHPSQENKVYFGSSTIDGPINYISEDAGETWVRVNSEIEYRAPVLFTPAQLPLLYAACEFSEKLCRSHDYGLTWEVVPGMTNPGALAAGTDGERVVIYVGSPGGVVTTEGLINTAGGDFIESTAAENKILGGGVYRLTNVLYGKVIYLPGIFR
jgi:photosystem II stability/assembly factor-like uncharacterized protein